MTDTWDVLWEEVDWDRVTTIPFITKRIQEIRAMGNMLQAAITQANECIGEFESEEWCNPSLCLVSGKCLQITLHVQKLEAKIGDVEKWHKHEADQKGDNPWWYNKRLRELAKTLGVEE